MDKAVLDLKNQGNITEFLNHSEWENWSVSTLKTELIKKIEFYESNRPISGYIDSVVKGMQRNEATRMREILPIIDAMSELALEENKMVRFPRERIQRGIPFGPRVNLDLPWQTVFSKSSLGPSTFFVRDTKSLYRWEYAHLAWENILLVCKSMGLPGGTVNSDSPGGVAATYRRYAFIDGGFVSKEGNYFYGSKGSWVIGRKALRYICYELSLTQPRRFPDEQKIPTHIDLKDEIFDQKKKYRHILEERLIEFERRFRI